MKSGSFLLLGMLASLTFFSCIGMPDFYLIKVLDDSSKSAALTEKGIAEYRLHLIEKGDLSQMDKVMRYFTNALKLDPANARAELYINRLRTFKLDFVKARLEEARRLYSKATRSENEDYQLLFAIRRAIDVDPTNRDAQKLYNDTRSLRDLSLARLNDTSERSLKEIRADMSPAEKERLYVRALYGSARALSLNAENKSVKIQYDLAREPLKAIVDDIVATAYELKTKDQFTNALKQADRIKSINVQTLDSFKREEEDLRFTLLYDWALGLERNRRYALALEKIEAALVVRHTDAAIQARKRIATAWRTPAPVARVAARPAPKPQVAEEGAEIKPADILAQVQSALDYFNLAEVKALLAELESMTLNAGEREKIQEYRNRVQTIVKEEYEKGLVAYREENFRLSIESFSLVNSWNEGYEQVADYLERSKDKQRIIDQFSEQ